MTKKERLNIIIDKLSNEFPDAGIELQYSNGFELLTATVLSAQCTDERVNKVTQELFQKYTSIDDYANCELEELEKDIFSTGFYKSKAKNIKSLAQIIIEKYNRTIPNNIDELTSLPGVGRKTANVVLGHYFNNPVGIVVDTHVRRISKLLGLTSNTDPEKIEIDLMKLVKKSQRVLFTHYLIRLGRKYCKARKRECDICPISEFCPSNNV